MFLFKQVDPNYTCVGKLEDEIVSMFKTLGYPFPIAKSNISAVGSPHAWPNMLASIMWLIELLNYGEAVSQSEQTQGYDLDIDDPTSSDKAFYKYLGKAYGCFISGKDEQYASLEEQFIHAFESKNVLIRDQIEALEHKNMALSNEIEEVKRRSAYLPELDLKRKELQREQLALSQLVEEKNRVRDNLKAHEEAQTNELDRIKCNITVVMREIAVLKEKVATQEISPEDVTNMVNERERLEEAQRTTSEHRQNMQRKIWELEMGLRDKVQGLEDTVRAYHSIAEDLKMIPQSARNARGENLVIEIDVRAKKREGLLKTQVKSHIVPILQDLRSELTGMTLELRQELMTEQEAIEELEANKAELLESREQFEAKLRRAEIAYKREKEALDQAAEIHMGELDTMESRLLQMRDTTSEESKITAATRRVTEAKALRSARNAEHERKKSEMIESITNVVGMCASHREMVQDKLDELKTLYGKKLETFFTGEQLTLNAESHRAIANKLLALEEEAASIRNILNLGMYKTIMPYGSTPGDFASSNGFNHREADDSVRFDEEDGLSPIQQQVSVLIISS